VTARTIIRVASIVLGVALISVVTIVIVNNRNREVRAQPCASDGPRTEVRGVIGSEKEAFFKDQRVSARFACAGLAITVDPRGSREMLAALKTPNHGYGFAFPSSTPTADKIIKELGVTEYFTPFSSPMVVATFKPIVSVLTRAKVVQQASDGSPVVDVTALLDLARQGTRWDRLPGNVEYPVRNAALLRTTDPRDSSSAIMFLSIASQVANDGKVVTTQDQLQKVMPDLCRLVFDQGTKPETSQVLFNQYLTDGMGRIPMALIYESQYLAKAPGLKPTLPADSVVLFPRPTVYSRHTLIPLNDTGRRVGRLLKEDPELSQLAEEYGFRVEGLTKGRSIPFDVVESPAFELLDVMLSALEPTEENARRCAAK
jgi:hypothetical protein